MSARHTPVMLNEMLDALAPKDQGIYVDGTFGAGGYTRAILKAAECRVFAIDRDPSTRTIAQALMEEFPGRFVYLAGNFADMCELLHAHGVDAVDGIVLDLGVSSMQLDEAERGFSFMHDGPLDMRMGADGLSAADWINEADEAEIADVLYLYGEEHASRRIARAIVALRAEKPITRTRQLAELIADVVGRRGEHHPATKSFQGIRIHINQELASIERALSGAEHLLKPGGRLVVVTFHSLEDRLVKRFTHSRCGKLAGVSRHLPRLAGGEDDSALPTFLSTRPEKVKPSKAEEAANPRSRSATLRTVIRNDAPVRKKTS